MCEMCEKRELHQAELVKSRTGLDLTTQPSRFKAAFLGWAAGRRLSYAALLSLSEMPDELIRTMVVQAELAREVVRDAGLWKELEEALWMAVGSMHETKDPQNLPVRGMSPLVWLDAVSIVALTATTFDEVNKAGAFDIVAAGLGWPTRTELRQKMDVISAAAKATVHIPHPTKEALANPFGPPRPSKKPVLN